MTYSVFQHWDPLRVCVVGRSYPPDFYQWITAPKVRQLFEKIAVETEEDFQNIIKTLQKFNVEVMRPDIMEVDIIDGKYPPPPMTPRDSMIMIHNKFYHPGFYWPKFYADIKDASWQWYDNYDQFCEQAPAWQIDEVQTVFEVDKFINNPTDARYVRILDRIKQQGNQLRTNLSGLVGGAMVSRIGRDLYFSTESYDADQALMMKWINDEFQITRNHIINTGGHGDSTYCPVCPGLIISLKDVPTYENTFPGWEVVHLPNQSWNRIKPFLDLKEKNRGRWWIPGFEYDQSVIDTVETWLGHWVGYVEETVFDVNILVIDPKNILMLNFNEQVVQALHRFGITAHVVPWRHRYFWDGGIHCITLDLHREGTMQDFFPERS